MNLSKLDKQVALLFKPDKKKKVDPKSIERELQKFKKRIGYDAEVPEKQRGGALDMKKTLKKVVDILGEAPTWLVPGLNYDSNTEGYSIDPEQAAIDMSLDMLIPVGGKGLSKAMKMAKNLKTPKLQMGGEADLIPIQTEEGEMARLPQGMLFPTGADESHAQMNSKEVTDAYPADTYIFSDHKSMKIPYSLAESVVLGKKLISFKEGMKPEKPENVTLASKYYSNKKEKLTPAELVKKIQSKHKISERKDDPITTKTNMLNAQTRAKDLDSVYQLSESLRKLMEGEDPNAQMQSEMEPQMAPEGVPMAQTGLDLTYADLLKKRSYDPYSNILPYNTPSFDLSDPTKKSPFNGKIPEDQSSYNIDDVLKLLKPKLREVSDTDRPLTPYDPPKDNSKSANPEYDQMKAEYQKSMDWANSPSEIPTEFGVLPQLSNMAQTSIGLMGIAGQQAVDPYYNTTSTRRDQMFGKMDPNTVISGMELEHIKNLMPQLQNIKAQGLSPLAAANAVALSTANLSSAKSGVANNAYQYNLKQDAGKAQFMNQEDLRNYQTGISNIRSQNLKLSNTMSLINQGLQNSLKYAMGARKYKDDMEKDKAGTKMSGAQTLMMLAKMGV